EALEKGAAYAIVDEPEYETSDRTILVDNALECLQKLATFHRRYCHAQIIALTGSNGKTTTKELIYAVLASKYRTIATQGNLNNHIGVALTLLRIEEDTEMAVVEMGANHQKEIEFLCRIAAPDFGYITNFGKAHLEGFGGVEGVIKGKSEMFEYLTAHGKTVFMNADDPIQLQKLGQYIHKVGFSVQDPQYYQIKFLGARPFVQLEVEGSMIQTQLMGHYNFSNCCAAILMGKYFGIPLQAIKKALEHYEPKNNRSQIITKNGHQIVLDAYNANPTSMNAALDSFENLEAAHKMVILGDMFELGESAKKEHQEIADRVAQIHFHKSYLVGENFYTADSKLPKFRDFDALAAHLRKHPLEKGTVLIKGSRGMALERVLEYL
ncbi:MAG: UDP-N-acetylmuramoyl-tripeptide--D-alanyl-D-alanine ligase, partial [Flavobacteriaceae bacterium]